VEKKEPEDETSDLNEWRINEENDILCNEIPTGYYLDDGKIMERFDVLSGASRNLDIIARINEGETVEISSKYDDTVTRARCILGDLENHDYVDGDFVREGRSSVISGDDGGVSEASEGNSVPNPENYIDEITHSFYQEGDELSVVVKITNRFRETADFKVVLYNAVNAVVDRGYAFGLESGASKTLTVDTTGLGYDINNMGDYYKIGLFRKESTGDYISVQVEKKNI